MREIGIDLAERIPQRLTEELAEQADVVVTMGCGDACPYIPASATSTGSSMSPPASPSRTSESYVTTSTDASANSSPLRDR
jgi:protein-tyrosine-phosphatase